MSMLFPFVSRRYMVYDPSPLAAYRMARRYRDLYRPWRSSRGADVAGRFVPLGRRERFSVHTPGDLDLPDAELLPEPILSNPLSNYTRVDLLEGESIEALAAGRTWYEVPLVAASPGGGVPDLRDQAASVLAAATGELRDHLERAAKYSRLARLAVVEGGWLTGKSAVRAIFGNALVNPFGAPRPELAAHGTSTLTLLGARRSSPTGPGLLPDVPEIAVFGSHNAQGFLNQAQAIEQAIRYLVRRWGRNGGQVLLLELQGQFFSRHGRGTKISRCYAPVEVEPAIHELIRWATALGITVIEPAGNGGVDMDDTAKAKVREPILDPTDSGAVMVGAMETLHSRLPSSNYGDRLDVEAPGKGIHTLSTHRNILTRAVKAVTFPHFGQTSAASAVTAAVAAGLQAEHLSGASRGLPPLELRRRLRRP